MDQTLKTALLTAAPALVGHAREAMSKEFVRRPARGWADCTPLPPVRLDERFAGPEGR